MNNEEALKQLGIEMPEGYEFVRYDYVKKGDLYTAPDNKMSLSNGDTDYRSFIFKKKIETDCWYFARFERESYPIYLSVDGDFYQMISYKGIGECKVTSEFEIISKMEAVK